MQKKIMFSGFGHICITVDDIDEATMLYKKIFNAIPIKHFPHSKGSAWNKNIGFNNEVDKVDVSIRFLLIPIVNLYIELLQYHQPISEKYIKTIPNTIRGISHIALTVNDIDLAFDFIKKQKELLINCSLQDYTCPLKINSITENDFFFFDESLENNPIEKSKAAYRTNTIRFFTFSDPYGVTWELEESEETYEF